MERRGIVVRCASLSSSSMQLADSLFVSAMVVVVVVVVVDSLLFTVTFFVLAVWESVRVGEREREREREHRENVQFQIRKVRDHQGCQR